MTLFTVSHNATLYTVPRHRTHPELPFSGMYCHVSTNLIVFSFSEFIHKLPSSLVFTYTVSFYCSTAVITLLFIEK